MSLSEDEIMAHKTRLVRKVEEAFLLGVVAVLTAAVMGPRAWPRALERRACQSAVERCRVRELVPPIAWRGLDRIVKSSTGVQIGGASRSTAGAVELDG
jgi:hypothetical protein